MSQKFLGLDIPEDNFVYRQSSEVELIAKVEKVKEYLIKWMEVEPFKRNRIALLAKAFCKWLRVFPIAQKCDELAKQLQERCIVLNTFRESYLRDVVSVKYHLDKIAELKLPDGPMDPGKDMYDLHTVPSTDLRVLIERALASANPSSLQLREALMQAGLVNMNGKDLNPWDKSNSYRRILKTKFGKSAEVPVGTSIKLFAPSRHRLFIRYCEDCIGTMSFVYDWNREIEDALALKGEGKAILAQLTSHKNLVIKLNEIITLQQQEIADFKHRNAELMESTIWFQKWGNLDKERLEMLDLHEQMRRWKETAGMAFADKESSVVNANQVSEVKIEVLNKRATMIKDSVKSEKMEREVERKARLDVLDRLRAAELVVSDKSTTVTKLTAKVQELQLSVYSLEAHNADKSRLIDELTRAGLLKDKEIEQLRREKILVEEDLNSQMDRLQEDYIAKEAVVDGLREIIRNQKQQIAESSKKFLSKKGLQKHRNYPEEFAQFRGGKGHLPLKVLCLAVRFAIRFARASEKKDYSRLGNLGKRIELKQLGKKVVTLAKTLDTVETERNDLKRRQSVIVEENIVFREKLEVTEKRLEEEATNTKTLLSTYVKVQERANRLENHVENVVKKSDTVKDEQMADLKKQLMRSNLLTEFQRSMLGRLMNVVFTMRSRLSLLNMNKTFNWEKEEDADAFDFEALKSKLVAGLGNGAEMPDSKPLSAGTLRWKSAVQKLMKWRKEHVETYKLQPMYVARRRRISFSQAPVPGTLPSKPNRKQVETKLYQRRGEIAEIFERDEKQVEKIRMELMADVAQLERCVSNMRVEHRHDESCAKRDQIRLEATNTKLMKKVMDAVEILVKLQSGEADITEVNIAEYDYIEILREEASQDDSVDPTRPGSMLEGDAGDTATHRNLRSGSPYIRPGGQQVPGRNSPIGGQLSGSSQMSGKLSGKPYSYSTKNEDDVKSIAEKRETTLKTALESVSVLEKKLEEAHAVEAGMTNRIDSLFVEIAETRLQRDECAMERDNSQRRLEELSLQHENALHQISLLRTAVEDSYRLQSTEIEKYITDREIESQNESMLRMSRLRNKGTQIACCVCAVRDAVNQNFPPLQEAGERSGSPSRSGSPVILSARPRKINCRSPGDERVDFLEKTDSKAIVARPKSTTSLSRESRVGDGGQEMLTGWSASQAAQPRKLHRPASAIDVFRRQKQYNEMADPMGNRGSPRDGMDKIAEKLLASSRPVSAAHEAENTQPRPTKFRSLRKFPESGKSAGISYLDPPKGLAERKETEKTKRSIVNKTSVYIQHNIIEDLREQNPRLLL